MPKRTPITQKKPVKRSNTESESDCDFISDNEMSEHGLTHRIANPGLSKQKAFKPKRKTSQKTSSRNVSDPSVNHEQSNKYQAGIIPFHAQSSLDSNQSISGYNSKKIRNIFNVSNSNAIKYFQTRKSLYDSINLPVLQQKYDTIPKQKIYQNTQPRVSSAFDPQLREE